MTMREIEKIEENVLGSFIDFISSGKKEKDTGFDGERFLEVAKKVENSVESRDANPDTK